MPPTDERLAAELSADSVRVLAWRGERARLEMHPDGPDGQPVTVIHPGDGRALSTPFVRHCLDQLADIGGAVMSPALGLDEVHGFEGAGFATRADLHLLVHDLGGLPAKPALSDIVMRRGGRHDVDAVLRVDTAAFPPLWQLDRHGLDGALGATPSVRYRVALDRDGRIVGYAITGRAGRRGYLQRLAVDPADQGSGIGRYLVLDGLAWCRRWRVRRVAVNTQHGNARALRLYRELGFVETSTGLRVMEYGLNGAPRRVTNPPATSGTS